LAGVGGLCGGGGGGEEKQDYNVCESYHGVIGSGVGVISHDHFCEKWFEPTYMYYVLPSSASKKSYSRAR